MVTIYDIKRNDLRNDKSYILADLRGLSTDIKPTEIETDIIENGSTFIEMDTQDIYFYDGSNETWINPNVDEQNEEQEEQQEGE